MDTLRELGLAIGHAAQQFIAVLFQQQKDGQQFPNYACFPFESENRLEWFYLPASLIRHEGLPLKSMNGRQQKAALDLVRASLSTAGIARTEHIRMLEFVLAEMEKNLANPFRRDNEAYHFTIFGRPSNNGAWGWRYEGHHVSLHWTIVDGEVISTTPQFFGTSPAEVSIDVPGGPPVGTRILAAEEDLARKLVVSLNGEQQRRAILVSEAPWDILTLNLRDISIQENRGVAYEMLTEAQQELLRKLVEAYTVPQPGVVAQERMNKVEQAGWDSIKFAWTGSIEKGQLHYYRIQGSTFLIEYDTPMNEPFHRHTVWRDFKGDWGRDRIPNTSSASSNFGHAWEWGRDVLREHYMTSPDHIESGCEEK
jgi:hypothetical protein